MKKLLMAAALFGAATCSSMAQPPDGPGPQGPPGGPGGPGSGPGMNRPSPEDFVNMAMRYDKDGDGKLDRDELMEMARETQPNRFQGRGFQGGPGGGFQGGPPEGRRPEGGPPPEGRRPEGGPPPEGRGPEGMQGPNPERFVDQAMRFDRDGDGKLNRDELLEFARNMPGPGQRPGMQGPGNQGPGNQGPRGEGPRGEGPRGPPEG
ncbi:MAG: EF-hand domain-containing protein, partial [Planctomycetota bacterium]